MRLKHTDAEDSLCLSFSLSLSLLLYFLKNAGRAQNWHQVAKISTQPTKPLELEWNWGASWVHTEVGLSLVTASPGKPKAPSFPRPRFSVPPVFAIRHSLLGD